MSDHSRGQRADESDAPMRRRSRMVFLVFAAIAAFFLLSEHRAHVLGFLPWILLLACPLMHLFMHHGHGHGHAHDPRDDSGEQK